MSPAARRRLGLALLAILALMLVLPTIAAAQERAADYDTDLVRDDEIDRYLSESDPMGEEVQAYGETLYTSASLEVYNYGGQTVAIERSSHAATTFAELLMAEFLLAATVGLLVASVRWAARA